MRAVLAAVGVLVVILGGCGGNSPEERELASFCEAQSEIEVNTNISPNDADAMRAELERWEQQWLNLDDLAPYELKDDFAVLRRFRTLSKDERSDPAERGKKEEAQETIIKFVKENC